MSLQSYGIELKRLDKNNTEDLEYCRILRNQDFVRSKLFYSDIISPEQHLAWFQKLTSSDYYFVVYYNKDRVGQCSFSIRQDGKAVHGCFFEKNWHGTDIPFRMALCVSDYAFQFVEKFICEIKNDNKKAISFNLFLGYKILNKQEDRIILELDKEDYLKAKSKIEKLLK